MRTSLGSRIAPRNVSFFVSKPTEEPKRHAKMSDQRLYCKLCHAAASKPLRLETQVREFNPSRQDDSIHIPVDEAWIVETLPLTKGRSPEKQIWFSPLSLTEHLVTDGNTFGCCGYIGLDNTRCPAGHVIGSRIDECAYQPRFEPNLKMTYWNAAHFAKMDSQTR